MGLNSLRPSEFSFSVANVLGRWGGFFEFENMGLDGKNDNEGGEVSQTNKAEPSVNESSAGGMVRAPSESSLCVTEDEDDDDEVGGKKIELGPQCTLKEQIEKDAVCIVLLRLFFCYGPSGFVYICVMLFVYGHDSRF